MTKNINPLLCKFSTIHNTAPFSTIKMEHYMPAFLEGIKIAKEELEKAEISHNNYVIPMCDMVADPREVASGE